MCVHIVPNLYSFDMLQFMCKRDRKCAIQHTEAQSTLKLPLITHNINSACIVQADISMTVPYRAMNHKDRKCSIKTLHDIAARFLDQRMYSEVVRYDVTLADVIERFSEDNYKTLLARIVVDITTPLGREVSEKKCIELIYDDFFSFLSVALEDMHAHTRHELVHMNASIGGIIGQYKSDMRAYVRGAVEHSF
jgi:hypothetical protein